MHPARDHRQRADSPPTDRPLQPEEASVSDVPPSWLLYANTSYQDQEAADEVDRLQGDTEMLRQLQHAEFRGKLWAHFSDVLAKYGYAVLVAWLFRREILSKCRDKGLRGIPPQLEPLEDDDVFALAGETVAVAIHHFRAEVLIPGKWDPKRRASLRTFFVGQCLIRFLEVYDRWMRENRYRHKETSVRAPRDQQGSADPASEVIQGMTVDEQLGDDERVAQVLRLVVIEDLPYKEVARRMSEQEGEPMTAKAVEAIVYRFRRRQQPKGA